MHIPRQEVGVSGIQKGLELELAGSSRAECGPERLALQPSRGTFNMAFCYSLIYSTISLIRLTNLNY